MVEATIPDHIKSFFDCSICFEEFTIIRYPCTMLCGHTICKDCVLKILSETNVVTCPLDKKKFKLTLISGNLSYLNLINRVKNFYLNTPFVQLQKPLIKFTKQCHNFSSSGTCKFGETCKFLHRAKHSESESSDYLSDSDSDQLDIYDDFNDHSFDDDLYDYENDYLDSSSSYPDDDFYHNHYINNYSDSSDNW